MSTIRVVDIIPQSLSGETGQDSEPNIAVNPANPNEIAISAFTADPMGGPNAPIFVSSDGGTTWSLNSNVPSNAITGDITPRFGGGSRFYAGILRRPGSLRLNILRTTNFASPTTMTVLVDRSNVDQPYTQAQQVPSGPDAGKDRVYVGINDLALRSSTGRTATVETSQDGAAAAAFTSARIERRGTGTAGQDGPQVRPAIHPDGTIYAAFYGWRSFGSGGAVTSDIVVVRDDHWGAGANPFAALVDPADGLAGRRIVTGVSFVFNGTLAQERLGGDLSIAVDPANSSNVYVTWCDLQAGVYTLHLRRSTDRGATWSAADLRTIARAKNPALAINSHGLVGLAYQCVTGTGTSQRWETHLETSGDGFATHADMVLATVPANTPAPAFLPYIGDYIHMMCVGARFYGTFSANNTPRAANFPHGVTFLRNHDFATERLLGVNGTTVVPVSIDPFFFSYDPTTFTRLTRLTALTRFTSFTRFTRFTSFTRFTRLTSLTRLTTFTRFTRFTVPPFTLPPGPGPDPGPLVRPAGAASVQPFIRFGNTVFAPEELDLARFEQLEGVVDELAPLGITRLHQLAMAEPDTLALQLGYSRAEAAALVGLAQALVRSLTQ